MSWTENQKIYLPPFVHWQKEGLHIFLDPERPHWIAVDDPGAALLEECTRGLPVGEMIRRYGRQSGFESAKSWLHVHDFLQALLRTGFASLQPLETEPYRGRAAYAQPTGLKELWLHTNNICNLSCTHCLVGSAPWVKDWGLPAQRLIELIDEAVGLGVDRFYMTGGEPFLRDDLFQLIRYVTEAKRCEIIVLTNAILLSATKRGEELGSLDREKVRFQVSLDGASAATNDPIRGKGSFNATLEGLRTLIGLTFEVSLTTVVAQANLKELPALTRLAADLGVKTQHLMWPHRRGRMVEHPELGIPTVEELIGAVQSVKEEAGRLGLRLDNAESIHQRVNGRPGVKYDLGNACWDSLCVYSDGAVYPSAALANVTPLALGTAIEKGRLEQIWRSSPVAQAFRNASVAQMRHLDGDPTRYLTGGGDLEHCFWFNLNGESSAASMAPKRLMQILAGPDPYHPLYAAMIQDAMWEWAFAKKEAVNRKSGYDAPRVLHAMGDGAIHCATDDLVATGEVEVRTLHSNCVLAFDVDRPRALVREFYAKAARTPQAELCCPIKFDDSTIAHIPKEVVDRFYGCGSPVVLGDLKPGETFVDLGSGAGIDCFIAAKLVGGSGRVIGVDMTDPMLEVANRNRPLVAQNLGYDAVEFRKGFLESVPVDSKWADLVTSNCVINLSPDKPKVFSEIWRILKECGRAVIADIVSDKPVPPRLKVNPRLWGECTVGALTQEEFYAQLQEAGFYGLSILKKGYWKTIEGYDFYSVTIQGFKFEKTAGCRFIGQKAVYRGPMKSVIDEEGHLFPRDVMVEVCTDTAVKLSKPPYAGSFVILEPDANHTALRASASSAASGCGPGCC